MNREDIIRMAREAGFESNSLGMTYTSGSLSNLLERFANLVAAAEQEECAKVCENEIEKVKPAYSVTAENALKAIRARGNSEVS
jgi:hypothetical protein